MMNCGKSAGKRVRVCVCACVCVCVCVCVRRIERFVEHCSNVQVGKRKIECALKLKHIWGRVRMGS